MRGTFTVRGQKVRTQTMRRYIVVAVRESADANGNPAFARVTKRTDDIRTARDVRRAQARRSVSTIAHAIVDTTTGNEVG